MGHRRVRLPLLVLATAVLALLLALPIAAGRLGIGVPGFAIAVWFSGVAFVVLAALAALGLWLLEKLLGSAPIRVAPRDALEDPSPVAGLGPYAGLVIADDPYEPIRRRIEAETAADDGPADVASAAAPGPPASGATCSACRNALEAEDAARLTFCYHCGASLI